MFVFNIVIGKSTNIIDLIYNKLPVDVSLYRGVLRNFLCEEGTHIFYSYERGA